MAAPRYVSPALIVAIHICYCTSTFAQFTPTIEGRVLLNNQPLANETVELFLDNGDLIFDPNQGDTLVGQQISNGLGEYQFNNLDPIQGYFTRHNTSTSGLILPGSLDLIVDPFVDTTTANANPITPSSSSASNDSSLLGGQRDVQINWLEGLGVAEFNSNPFGITESAEINTSGGVRAEYTLTWDGIDADSGSVPFMGLDGTDLEDGNQNEAFLLQLGFDDAAQGEQMILRVFEGSSANFSEASFQVPITGGLATAAALIPFSDFSGPVSMDDVDAIQLIFQPNQASIDGQIAEFGVLGPKQYDHITVAVSEPTLTVVAIVFLSVFHQLRKRLRWVPKQ